MKPLVLVIVGWSVIVGANRGPAHADTILAGGVLPGLANTWNLAGSPYIIQGDLTVPAGATLTIQAGVEVRATANSDLQASGLNTARVELIINGGLYVDGTAASPVTFHSSNTTAGSWYGIVANTSASEVRFTHAAIQHPIYGVTSHVLGAALQTDNLSVTSASIYGLWLRAGAPVLDTVTVASTSSIGIYVGDAVSPTLSRCIVRNSGNYGIYVAHTSAGQTLGLDNCTLTANGVAGVYSSASAGNAATITVTDSIITSSSYGVYRADAATWSVTDSNVWSNSSSNYSGVTAGAGTISANPLYVSATDLRLTSNSPSRFGASGGGDQGALPYDVVPTPGLYGVLWSNTTLTQAASPYTAAGDVTVASGVTLTIEAGATINFSANTDLMLAGRNTARGELTVRGTLVADGTPLAPITIGSTNTTNGSWYGVELDATATGSLLDNVTIRRAIYGLSYRSTGAGNVVTDVTTDLASIYGLWLLAGSPSIDGYTSIGASSMGIQVAGAASPTLTRCIVRNSGNYGIYVAHTTPGRTVALDNCTLYSNGVAGVYSSAAAGNAATITVTDSIITSSSYGVYRADAATWSVTNTDVWSNSSANYSGVTAGAGTISANPLYVSGTDLRLTSNSPARFGAAGGGDQGARPYDVVPTPGLYGVLWTNTTLTAAGGPYTAAGDLTVAPGVTLTIEAGATINFTANTDIMLAGANTARGELQVRGTLIADGTAAAPITIASTNTTSGSWYGVDLEPASTSTVLDHVTIRRAIYGLTYRSTAAGNSIAHVTTELSSIYGLWLRAGSPSLDGMASISSSSMGVYVGEAASPVLTNCVVRNSGNYGVYVANTSAGRTLGLINCTLNANGVAGVYSSASAGNASTITVTNAVITNSSYGVYRADAAAWTVTYADVWNNSSANYSGVTAGVGTISANPQYVSATDLHVQGTSVAIDAGTTGPTSDAEGVTRPLDGNGIGGAQWDLGAYEFPLAPMCGNGAVEPGETCDDGVNNGMYGYCNSGCSGAGERCGDSIMNGPEQCDDGNTANTDACLNSCLTATCGDGFIRAGIEQCDDANMSNTDACTNTCATAVCGDGFVRAGVEACDDANMSNTDACLGTCVAASCGDGFVHAGVEACDDANPSNTDACLNTCNLATCGDGFIQTGVEQCDDGNMIDTDACTAVCADAACGDGVIQTGVEQCDDGNTVDTDACVGACVDASCGDGFVRDGIEGCDDGNTIDTDACTNACVSSTCGDGVLQAGVEECDDGNTIDTDACRYNCIDAACGDGVVRDGVEACDDGNVDPGDGCSPACALEGGPDAGGPDPGDGGGCCQTSGGGFPASGLVLAMIVLVGLRRPRYRR